MTGDGPGDAQRQERFRAGWQSAVFLLLAPGIVAGLIPWLITGWQWRNGGEWSRVAEALGWILIVAGVAFLVHAFALFVVRGLGTPAPVAPTKSLVVSGTYGWVRNPMYLAVTAIILGQALLFASWALLGYAAAVVACFVTFVHFYEEPTLRTQFGAEYVDYLRTVPGWWPRPPHRSSSRSGSGS